MQEALPYKLWQHFPTDFRTLNKSSSLLNQESKGDVKNMITENAVIVFGRCGCCMSHVIKCLLHFLGVNPVIYDIEEKYENEVVKELEDIGGGDRKDGVLQLPAVFVGGELFGGLDRIMAAHISGELTPVLKQAGALWL